MENKKRIYFKPFSQTNFVLPKNDLSIPEKHFLYKNSQPKEKPLIDNNFLMQHKSDFVKFGSRNLYYLDISFLKNKKLVTKVIEKDTIEKTNNTLLVRNSIASTLSQYYAFIYQSTLYEPKLSYYENTENLYFVIQIGTTYNFDSQFDEILRCFDIKIYEFKENPNNIFKNIEKTNLQVFTNYSVIELPNNFKTKINIKTILNTYVNLTFVNTHYNFCLNDQPEFDENKAFVKNGFELIDKNLDFSNSEHVYLIVYKDNGVTAEGTEFDYILGTENEEPSYVCEVIPS